ncbi:MAG: DUF2605 domain-containing protein [Actinomycetota bacterium]
MLHPKVPEPDLLKTVLQPLLADFQYWFERSAHLLESEEIPFLTAEQHSDLLARVKQAQQEVSATQTLLEATEGQVGVETAVLMPWHHLLTECWQVAIRFRKEQCVARGQ